MLRQFFTKLKALDLEEKVLNAGALAALIGVFLPWIGGRPSLLDDAVMTYTGLGHHTALIGYAIAGLELYTLLITIVPLTGAAPLVRRDHRDIVRLNLTTVTSILILASLSVLMRVSFSSPGLEVRFGIYLSLVGSLFANLYAYLNYQVHKRKQVENFFSQATEQHIQQNTAQQQQQSYAPPAPKLEEHQLTKRL